MWVFILRKLFYNIPVYIAALLLMFVALRVNNPVYAYLGKQPSPEQIQALTEQMGLDDPLPIQFAKFLGQVFTLNFSQQSWAKPGENVRDIILEAIPPSLSITVPALLLSTAIGVCVALISAFYRGRLPDRSLVILAVIGMSVSFLVYIIFGQFFGAFYPQYLDLGVQPFAIEGYEPWIGINSEGGFFARPDLWIHYCLLPVLISVIVSMGYDTRFYRAVMVEESGRDYIVTAVAKGASKQKVMFVHMLKNAMIPVITRVMSTLPFLITGSILLEVFFNIPGMGRELISAINSRDFPVIQAFVAVFAAFFIVTVILTDVLYALVDPRVRLS
ncbi:MAG: ABC transporter permease [Planctomycetota bacterium]